MSRKVSAGINPPLGGTLISRIAPPGAARALMRLPLPALSISAEHVIELWNIADGAYSPLTGFMGARAISSVLKRMRTPAGVFWPIPIVLDISAEDARRIRGARQVFLADQEGTKLAVISAEDVFRFPKKMFEKGVFGTTDTAHPGVARVEAAKPYLLAGDITWIAEPLKTTRPSLTPAEARAEFRARGWRRVVAFHTRNIPHRGHEHVQRAGLARADGLLVQPLIGTKKKGDFHNHVVAKTYRHFVARVLPRGKAILSFLPYSAYFAGPREALLTAVIRKNFGCTHFIVGRDHTGVGDYYSTADYTKAIRKHAKAMDIEILHYGKAIYCRACKGSVFEDECPHDPKYHVHQAGREIRSLLTRGKLPPAEIVRPAIGRILLGEKDLFV